jgi:hypothetical protein
MLHENLRPKILMCLKYKKKNLFNEGTTIIDHPPHSPDFTS